MSTKKGLTGWAGRLFLRGVPSTAGFGLTRSGRKSRPVFWRRVPLCLEPIEDRIVLSPTVLDPNLAVRTVVSGLITPTTLAFFGDNDFIVLEKATGKVDHIINGVNAATKFDFGAGPIANLPVNNASERGLLGIALSPNFANDHNAYMYWTQSTTGAVSTNTAETPLLGNRVDRFIWNAATSTFTFDKNIIRLHAFQDDHNNPANPAVMNANHNGGVIHFGPDGKLYIVIGDNGRRGWMQNLVNGPIGPGIADDQFGGPAPDDAHLTGVLLRLNPDGSIPDDNPFVDIQSTLQAPVLSGAGNSATGSFTAFLNQAMDTFTAHVSFKGLPAPAIAAQVRLGGADGPVIFTLPTLPQGATSGDFMTTLTPANFVAEPPNGIFSFSDAVRAVLNGRANFTIFTTQFPSGEISGTIAQLDPQITNNLHKVFAYGIRNTFGFNWDPVSKKLWLEENGDQSFDKISIVSPGANNGWVQSSAPLLQLDGTLNPVALAEFKSIELRLSPNGPQQIRWPSANIADTPEEALSRMLMLPGAFYNPPVFSVRAEHPPAGLNFMTGLGLGPQYQNVLFEGSARDFSTSPLEQFDGALLIFHPNNDRTGLDFGNNPLIRSTDHVFLNDKAFDLKGDRSLLFGTGFGIGTDIQTGPDGNLWVVSLTKGEVYEIFRKDAVSPMQSTNLVSNLPDPPGGAPQIIDPLLKNPWGVVHSPTSPFWVANAGSGTSTLYAGDVNGSPLMKVPLEVTIPPRSGGPQGLPSGVVFNGTSDFVVDGNPARFIFAGLDGTISAWNSGTEAQLEVTTAGAVYTGLAIGNNGSGNFLYAANVAAGRIDVFDSNFRRVSGPGVFAFEDPNLPPGLSSYHPFNIQNLNGTLYVTYENFNPQNPRVANPGGIVDAFDTNGNFLRRVVTGGLNAPWGLAIAPDSFGKFGNALLVGNFGEDDGKINAFDLKTGAFLGYLTDAAGNPLVFEDIWTLTFGNGGMGGDANTLYFSAGIHDEQDGLFGSIRVVSASGQLPAPTQSVDLSAVTTLDVGAATQLIKGFKPMVPGLSSWKPPTNSDIFADAILSAAPVQLPGDGLALAGLLGPGKVEDPALATTGSHDVGLSLDEPLTTLLQSDGEHLLSEGF